MIGVMVVPVIVVVVVRSGGDRSDGRTTDSRGSRKERW